MQVKEVLPRPRNILIGEKLNYMQLVCLKKQQQKNTQEIRLNRLKFDINLMGTI
jgi:hypothetical protein